MTLTTNKKVSFCFRRCKPRLGCNDCVSPLACTELSGRKVGLTGKAVCVQSGCDSNADCPVTTGKDCDTAKNSCPGGQQCQLLRNGSTAGKCAVNGKCDLVSGLCAPHSLGNALAKVGDACKGDQDCGGQMHCLAEFDAAKHHKAGGATCSSAAQCCSGKCQAGICAAGYCSTEYRNGYCAILGCRFADSLVHKKCPAGSHCNGLYVIGSCQKACDLTKAADCRGLATDKVADYECRAWNRVNFSSGPGAAGPVCDLGSSIHCSFFSGLGQDCSDVGLAGNPTNMTCRDLNNNILLNKKSATGYCLDSTSSDKVAAPQDAGAPVLDGGQPASDQAAPAADGGAAASDTCAGAKLMSFNAKGVAQAAGSTKGATNSVTLASTHCTSYASPGPDRFHAVTLTGGQTYTVTLTPDAIYDPMLYALTDCGKPGPSCSKGSDIIGSGKVETLVLTPTTSAKYVIAVDSYGSTEAGGYTLAVRRK